MLPPRSSNVVKLVLLFNLSIDSYSEAKSYNQAKMKNIKKETFSTHHENFLSLKQGLKNRMQFHFLNLDHLSQIFKNLNIKTLISP